MEETTWLTEQFEAHRTRLRGVAYRMLGSISDADDAVQETWLRLHRQGDADIDNVGGWLTTVTSRICLDILRARRLRQEDSLDVVTLLAAAANGAEEEAALADAVGLALMVVLTRLSPAERISFVLHEMFGIAFEHIAPIVSRSPAAARKLASRARARVRGASTIGDDELARQRDIAEAFLAAARTGDLQGLLAVLDPAVVLRTDATAARLGQGGDLYGASAVAASMLGKAQVARTVLIEGRIGVVVAPTGKLLLALRLNFVGDRIGIIDAIADADRLDQLVLSVVPILVKSIARIDD